MPDTHGFEVVAQITENTLLEFLQAAWDNGGTGDEGSIPHEVEIAPGVYFPPYKIEYGQASIPRSGLSLEMAPADNGVKAGFDTTTEITLKADTVPVPSLRFLSVSARIDIPAPFGAIAGSDPNIGVIFEGLPRSEVVASLASDPIGPITTVLIEEYMHELYKKEEPPGQPDAFPHTIELEDQNWLVFSFDAHIELFSDPDTPDLKVTATMTDATHVAVSIPIHIKLFNVTSSVYPLILSPMGVTGWIVITAPYDHSSGKVMVTLSSAEMKAENIQPADGIEGTNYTTNKAGAALMSIDLDEMMKAEIAVMGQLMLQSMDNIEIIVPTPAQIESIIEDHVHANLLDRKYFGVWTPSNPEGSPVEITSVRPKALDHALAIGINPGAGANEDLLADFIPTGSKFAVALEGDYVHGLIDEIVNKPESEGGLGGIPKHYNDIEGHAVDVTELNWALQSGKIHFWGDATVHDVFCGADADISFWADIGLRWSTPDSSGGQTLIPYVIDKDSDLPWWAWLLAVLTFLAGVIVGIIAIIVTAVIENVVEKVGGSVMADEVSGKLQAIGAWPQELQGIGTVETEFRETVGIDSSGLLFSGPLTATATFALTATYPSHAGGPYSGKAATAIDFHPGYLHSNIDYKWNLGDGTSFNGNNTSHVYIENGLYVIRMQAKVNEPGGAITHYTVPARVENVSPAVNAGSDLVVNEGDEITFTGSFTDEEYPDTHEAYWDFGDDTAPIKGTVIETNTPPRGKGTVTGKHAYCESGEYTVTLSVRDDDGGVGKDTLRVTVRNVPPKVDAGDIFYAYPCTPVNLIANFTDPGWCDTHTAQWDFGDTGYSVPATVYEVHEPPFGYGIAFATHTYRTLGNFCAECTVTDDDGGTGKDKVCVHVIDVRNRDFEDGFRNRVCGSVANKWEPYQLHIPGARHEESFIPASESGPAIFDADEFIVCEGQRAQRIHGRGRFRAGILQKIGANPGWEYQVIAWYHLDENHGGKCRVGLDPGGGNDPASSEIIWFEGSVHRNWLPLTVRATSKSKEITIFLEAESDAADINAYFDHVRLTPYPCPVKMPKRPVQPEPKPRRECCDWADEKETKGLDEPYEKNGFTFQSSGEDKVRIVRWGKPENIAKLMIPRGGLMVHLPFESTKVYAECISYARGKLVMRAYNSRGDTVDESDPVNYEPGAPFTLVTSGEAITYVLLSYSSGEDLLIRICTYQGHDRKGKIPALSEPGANKNEALDQKK